MKKVHDAFCFYYAAYIISKSRPSDIFWKQGIHQMVQGVECASFLGQNQLVAAILASSVTL